MQLQVGAWHAGYDYVRLTSREVEYGEAPSSVYGKASVAIVDSPGLTPAIWKPWAWMGYYGETCSCVSYGAGNQGAILQVSGHWAEEARRFNPPYDNVARVDIQVTVWLKRDVPHVARWAADESAAARKDAHGGKWRLNVRDGYGEGDTCYIGSRQSDVFIRIYDKWRESGMAEEYRHAWRFEIELSGAQAAQIWAGAHTTEPGAETVAGWVRWYLASRGVSLPDTVPSVLATTPVRPSRETDNDRRLAWLRNQVRPSIDKMLASGVELHQVADALGLSIHEAAQIYTKLRGKNEGG